MTSTGRGDFGAKSSSRVLRPPGGGTSINIFAYSDEPAKPATAIKSSSTDAQETNSQPTESSQPADPLPTNDVDESAAADGDVVEEDKEDKAVNVDDELTAVATAAETETQAVADNKPTATRSSDVDANLKKGRAGGSGFNPITGEPYSSNNNTQTQDSPKSQIRVRQPPGGASTKLW
jgi:hypothetical protein